MAAAVVTSLSRPSKRRSPVRRWILPTLCCLAVHVLLIFALEKPLTPPGIAGQAASRIQLLTDPLFVGQLMLLPDVADPAAFALPSIDGFSGSAWLAFKSLKPAFAPSVSPPHWLELSEGDLANVFDRLFPTNSAPALHIADLPLPSLIGSVPQVERELPAPLSRVHAEGALAQRLLPANNILPAWPHPDVLGSTTVQVVVNGEGRTASATILSACGLKEADAFALRWAQNCRFKPWRITGAAPARSSVTIGKLVFEWQTSPPATPAPVSSAAATP